MGDSEQSDKAKEFDGYFEAWARTIVEQLYDTMIANMKDPASADDTALVNDVKRELLDAWHHRAGEGAPPECIAFIAEHSPMRKLDALPNLDKADPIGDLITRFEAQKRAILELSEERDVAQRNMNEISKRIARELHTAGIADGLVMGVRKMREELVECRTMLSGLLGVRYTREGVRETFNAWKDECMRQGRHIPLPIPNDRPTRPDAPQSRQGMTLGRYAYEAFWSGIYKGVGDFLTREPHVIEQWEAAGQGIAKLFMQAYPMLASDIATRFAPPFALPIEPLKSLEQSPFSRSMQNMLTLPPDEGGSTHPKSINITLNMPNASIKDVQAIAAELNSTLIIPLQGERSRLPSVEISYGSLRDLLNREASLSKQCDELHRALCDVHEDHISYQVRELFNVVLPDQERLDKPGIPSEATVRFRVRLIAEEFVEMLRSIWKDDPEQHLNAIEEIERLLRELCDTRYYPGKVNLPAFIDACGDLDVVVEGARIAFGVDGRPIARAIHAANMAKKDGPKRESDGKRLKPPGWKPADIEGELRKQGWKGAD